MSVVANVAINVDSRDATSKLNALNAGADKLQQAFGSLGTALAGLGLSALTQQLGAAGLDADRTAKRIKSLADANGETSKVFDIAGKAAKAFGLSTVEAQKGVADLYGRLRPAGISLSNIETVFNGVNKAAAAAGLTSADTSGVFLQLSQALGSGALQGDELRSIMEQMPAVGQAVAKVMGVTVGEVKKLGADGKITTDIMIKAAAELNKLAPPPPDPFKLFNAEMENLRVELGENILPIITPFVKALVDIAKAFGSLPEPVQTAVVGLGLIVTAILAIGSAVAVLTPVITALTTLGTTLAGLGIGATIAGWAGAIGPAIAAMTTALSGFLAWLAGTLLPGLLAFFSGPAGWITLAVVALVAAAIAFREPLMNFLAWLWEWSAPVRELFANLWNKVVELAKVAFDAIAGAIKWAAEAWIAILYQLFVRPWVELFNMTLREPVTAMIEWAKGAWAKIAEGFNQFVVEPIKKAWTAVVEFIPNAIKKIGSAIKGVFDGIAKTIKNVFNSVLRWIASKINGMADLINNLIRGFNRLPGPDIPLIPKLSVPQFAQGGTVDRPTLAMVGEGGEREYIVPESKMAQASANYLAGARGNAVLGSGTNNSTPIINITTGPVVEFNGQRYVTLADMERAMRITADSVIGKLRTPGSRIALGIS